MKVHNIVTFLLIGLATATRPPYGSHSSTSAKAQVGKAILVRIPLDSEPPTSQEQYKGDYHEPTSNTNNRNRGQYQGYGYEGKDEPETRSYPESRPVEASTQERRPEGYASYGASPIPEADPRQKLVLLIPDTNKETSQGYTNQQSNSNYAPRQPLSQPSEEIVYSKPLSPSGTKLTEKKNQYQNSNKEHHKVPLILITLNKDEKLAVKPSQESRISPGYGKSWQPMITESRAAPVQHDRQSYESDSRSNQQANYNEWRQGQPIRQESQTTGASQWQTPDEVQDDKPQRNPQSTEDNYDQWKSQRESAVSKNNYNSNNQGGRDGYGSQQNSYSRAQEQSQTSQESYPQQYQRSYQSTESSKHHRPSAQPEQQSYQRGYYQRETSLTGNQQDSNYQGNQDSKYPQQNQEPKYTRNNLESRYPQQSHESRYQQTNSESRYPQQSHESRYEQTNTEARYPQQAQESKYQQNNQESKPNHDSRYEQTVNQDSRYPEQRQETSSYQQVKTETRYQQTNQDNRYPQQTQDSRYPQENQESRYPQASQETRYTQTNQESRYPEQTQESKHPETSQDSANPQNNQETRYANQNQESRYENQDSRYAYNQPSTGNTYAQTSENRYPQESSIGHGTGYSGQTSVRSNQDQSQTKQETSVPVKTQWRQASSYVPEQVEPTRTSEDYEKPVRGSYQGYSGPQSAGPRAEESWKPQASSQRSMKTRGERTKGVVVLLLSNDDKDGYARRSSDSGPVVPAIPSTV